MSECHPPLHFNGKLLEDFGLPIPVILNLPRDIEYNAPTKAVQGATLLASLNVDQRTVYDHVMVAVVDERSSVQMFFVDGPGGTGKTTLYTSFMSVLRGLGKSVLPVAYTGVTAMLMDGSWTVHSKFGLPFGKLTERSTSTIRLQSQRITKIHEAFFIIWDEAPILLGLQFTVVDRLLKDILKSNLPFGGKTIIFGGGFRQILSVVPHGMRSHIVNACIKSNALWPFIQKFALTRNMRANGDPEFAAWLLQLGNGRLPVVPGTDDLITIPDRFVYTGPLEEFVFPDRITIDNLDA